MSPVRVRLLGIAPAAALALSLLGAPAASAAPSKAGGAQAPAGGTKAPSGSKPAEKGVESAPEPEGSPTEGGGAAPEPTPTGAPGYDPYLPTVPGRVINQRYAIAPLGAPLEVQLAVNWANRITGRPYRYGGGHRRFRDSAYDCSGTISYALRGASLLDRPLDSRAFARWGEAGAGRWITVYTNPGHAYVVIAGMRFDTSGAGEKGPRWRKEPRSPRGFRARHIPGL